MVSPELLRRYPFFSGLDEDHLRALAMLSEDVEVEEGREMFREGQEALYLFLLVDGALDIHYVVEDEIDPSRRKDLFVAEINPGEPFGISAMVEPYRYTSTVRVTRPSRLVRIQSRGLRALCQADPRLEAAVMKQMAGAAMSRLHDTRVQLVAARP